jgi:hypothetical protein
VILDHGDTGTVVYDIDRKPGSVDYPDGAWDYLEKGAMIKTDGAGIDSLRREFCEHLVLVNRKDSWIFYGSN